MKEKTEFVGCKLSRAEYSALRLISVYTNTSLSEALRLCIHNEAERRGLREGYNPAAIAEEVENDSPF